ncbi:hypothetical protein [Streptomyces mirabilis]|uniref:hypothetical protein n=1 Tax=Streptomyces mirabilis TaxID=68239 RepID=UPI0036D00261
MSKHDDDIEYEVLLGLEPEDGQEDGVLTEEQVAAINKISNLGFQVKAQIGKSIRFADRRGIAGPLPRREGDIRIRDLSKVASTLDNYLDHEEFRGIISRDGTTAEFLIGHSNALVPAGRIFEQFHWEYPKPECGHSFAPWHIKTPTSEYATGFHLQAPSGDACVEISGISPVAAFLAQEVGLFRADDYSEYTLKVILNTSRNSDSNVTTVQQIANDLLFELDAKYNLALSLILRKRPVRSLFPRPPKGQQSINFPATHVPREVAALFSFAAEAGENPPFAFLSYYQVLEYYMPVVSRRDALKRLRREIRDFSFDVSDDASVLRVLHTAERVKGISEEDALKILVRDCVREDKLTEFFESEVAAEHFSRRGPIQGVPAINLKSTSESVQVQTAKRIYALRNRIVHAKDDPRYVETPQLLPRSAEANLLGPDVLLARLLALETIIDTQD